MAVTHVSFDNTQHGQKLRHALQSLEEGKRELNDVLGNMATMLNGDGSQAAHFTYATTKYGFPSDIVAKAAWDELNSAASKLNTDASVAAVDAALKQLFNKFR